MSTDINAQIIKSYAPGDPAGAGAFQEELQNQQLNDALQAGTVDAILMKTGYSAVYDHHVVIKKDLGAFVTIAEVINQIAITPTYNFGDYLYSDQRLYVKSNSTYATTQATPTTAHITHPGELAVDNFNGALYLLGNGGTQVVKVDAGTVNGFVVQKDVLSGAGETAIMTRGEIRAMINSAFSYNAGTNSLTIRTI